MHDSRRYRDSAAECLLAAQGACELHCRRLHLSMADSWLSLARRDEAMDSLLASWDTAEPVKTDGWGFSSRSTNLLLGEPAIGRHRDEKAVRRKSRTASPCRCSRQRLCGSLRLIAELEGPSFISRTVAHRRTRTVFVTQDPNRFSRTRTRAVRQQ